MKVAVEGCAHGELDKIYEVIEHTEEKCGFKIDLLICCGDFQATRNNSDLRCMAVPQKYQKMCSFYKYYSGEKKAPVLTLFIGGNHEASNYLQELFYGGWVAPNIYYLGVAGVVRIGGLRIGGISGIYKSKDYYKGHFESFPYSEDTKRSVYHVRNLEAFRLKQIKSPIDIFLSHDWPRGIYKYGDAKQLIRFKPFFADEISDNSLGSPVCEELLDHLKPKFWFAAHLHCKFAALVPHGSDENGRKLTTKFLALDKCLPRRRFMQILDIAHDESKELGLEYDLEWLTILHFTNHLLSVQRSPNYLPGPGSNERYDFTPTEEEKEFIMMRMGGDLLVPDNFCRTAPPLLSPNSSPIKHSSEDPNPQTAKFCSLLGVSDPAMLVKDSSGVKTSSFNENEDDPNFDKSSLSFIESDLSTSTSCTNSPSLVGDFTPSPKMKERLSQFLPPPKFESPSVLSELQFPVLDDSIGSTEESNLELKQDSTEQEKEDTTEVGKLVTPPEAKKFKRRNHELYKSDETEEAHT